LKTGTGHHVLTVLKREKDQEMEAEVSIQSLLDKIKKEGIEEAESSAQAILETARSEAAAIVQNARKEADSLLAQAEREVQESKAAFERELAHAGRDLILGVKQELMRLLESIVLREVRAALTPETVRELLIKLAEKWRMEDESGGIEILMNEDELSSLGEAGIQALQQELKKPTLIRPVRTIESGFRIGERDGAMHYDFTGRGITEILAEYLNPRFAKFLTAAPDESDKAP
jgi:V/A-type H+-transporting ATPase subunit E